MKNTLLLLFFLSIIYSIGCHPKIKKEYISRLTPIPAEYNEPTPNSPSSNKRAKYCREKINYAPDPAFLDHTPVKHLRVNFHIMRDSKGQGNFPDKKMGRAYVKKVLDATNQKLTQNAKMFLPKDNETPVLPMCYQFDLTADPTRKEEEGIYFHDDDDLFFIDNQGSKRNIFKKGVYEKYGIQKDSVLNIFIMGFHPDSVLSKTYKMNSNGVAFGNWVKLASWYYFMKDTTWHPGKEFEFTDFWSSQRLLNHEIGHCLGLRHSWTRSDGCDDTPPHPSCWNYTKNGSACDSLVSNNIMDYTAHAGAWTPCQIGVAHYNMARKESRIRKLVKKTWCEYDESKTVYVREGEDVNWYSQKDFSGNIVVKNNASLTIHCRVSLPPNGKIIVEPKGKLTLSGATLESDCEKKWKGIEVWSEKDNKGDVKIINDAKIINVENEIQTVVD